MEEPQRRRRLEALFRAHAKAVHAYARRRTTAANADDVVSEVFAVSCRRLDDLPDEPLPWLLACAHRVLANQRRGARRSGALRARLAGELGPQLPADEGDGLLVASPSESPAGFSESGGCVPNSMLLAGKFSPGWFSPGETVVGLAPNGNRAVTLKLSDGSTRTVPVLDNTYAVHTDRIIRTVTLRDSAGRLQTWNVPDGTPG